MDAFKTIETRQQMHEAAHIAAHFCRTVPTPKRKHRAPHRPEVALEKLRAKAIFNCHSLETSFAAKVELQQLPSISQAETEQRSIDTLPILNEATVRRGTNVRREPAYLLGDAELAVEHRNGS